MYSIVVWSVHVGRIVIKLSFSCVSFQLVVEVVTSRQASGNAGQMCRPKQGENTLMVVEPIGPVLLSPLTLALILADDVGNAVLQ